MWLKKALVGGTSEELLLAMVGRGDLGRVEGKLEEGGKLGNIFSPLFLSPTFTGIRNNWRGIVETGLPCDEQNIRLHKIEGLMCYRTTFEKHTYDIVAEMFGQKT